MKSRTIGMVTLALAGVFASGCAQNGGSVLSTASVAPEKMAAPAQPKVDAACVSLASQIDTLRNEGAVERLEKAAAGKTANVQVKRTSLAKQAELNKANADFQTRCGPQIPRSQSAQATPAAVKPVAAAAAVPAAQAAAKQAAASAPVAAAAAQAAKP